MFFCTFVSINLLEIMATTKKVTADKKSTAKTNGKLTTRQLFLQEKDPKKTSKTGLAMRAMAKDPWFKVNDWKAVNK